jgi:16S rRNA (cytosine967-C5)-methyltransferase
MSNARRTAVEILGDIINKGAYSNIALNNKLNRVDLEERDKALVTEIVYGTLKYKYTIDKILNGLLKNGIQKIDSGILNILRISIYQMSYLTKIPEFAIVNEAVEMAKKLKGLGVSKLVNGVLRNYIRSKSTFMANNKSKLDELCFTYSFEPWMAKLFIKQYGEETAEKILGGLNSTPNVTVRTNSIKTDYEKAFEELRQHGYEVEPGIICPEAIRITRGSSIEKNPLFKNGHVTVQDESAMLVAPAMGLRPDANSSVLDLCSAPGGKTTHISEILNNKGSVIAFDIHEDKLPLIKSNASRLGITNINCSVMDATSFNSSLVNSAEAVLIDVPCSGLGIIRKKPEIKWTKNPKELESIVGIQKEIMKNAAQYVKPGGVLLYSTCTLNKSENEKNIQWFLNNYANFEMEPVFYGEMDNIIYSPFGLTILPNEYMDGFFIAKLKRKR